MNRLAACTIVGLCISLSACKSADAPPPAPPPPPAPEAACKIPVDCQVYSGKISVPKDGKIAAALECLVVDRKTLVQWQGDLDVTSLKIEWQDVSVDYYCDAPLKDNPVCTGKDCVFDPSKVPPMTVDYCLCYKLAPTATDGTTMLADPRLIIRR